MYAHSPNKNWYQNAKPDGNCTDIITQLLETANIDVMLGGGKHWFIRDNGAEHIDLAKNWQDATGGGLVHTLEELRMAKEFLRFYILPQAISPGL